MTPVVDPKQVPAHGGGLRGSIRRVAEHLRALARLEQTLAQSELKPKAASLGIGAALVLAAGVLALFAVGFGLAAIAAALALAVAWWLALLIVFASLLLVIGVLALVARALFRRGTPLVPEQALEEARLTMRFLRGTRAG